MKYSLDWFGCATFRLTIGDSVVFLDAYVDRIPGADGPCLPAGDVARADWILIGHSHFDHLWGAATIARNTGATIVGSYESIRVMSEQGVPAEQLIPVAGGEPLRLADDVCVTAYPSLHSCIWARAGERIDQACLDGVGLVHQERMMRSPGFSALAVDRPPAALEHLSHIDDVRGDGGALVYMIETPGGRLLYQDTSGRWTGILEHLRPDVAILALSGRGNVDGEPVQGSLVDFVANEAELLQPKHVIFSHHDNWFPGLSRGLDVDPLRQVLAKEHPQVSIVDLDYLDGYQLFR